ncbi:MAG TPA: [protein-PII] uridylyltransferase [Pyrinomonadaceae bacterium]|jgi:[protein-PII] uridylyltransferase|nr:[protein-PII] uridylyltransferase [Pyrinomonadaceae bacterium]
MRALNDKVRKDAALLSEAVAGLDDPAAITSRLRAFLKLENQRLKMAHRSGAAGRQTAAARSLVVDEVVKCAFESASWPGDGGEFLDGARAGCSLVAVGGYGRAELAPFSDLDLVFLHTGRRSDQTKMLAERVLRLLWDAGLTVGHSFRTARECTAAARDDLHFRTALLCARPLAGSGALAECLFDSLERERRKGSEEFLSALREERDARYARFGASVCLQEPNVKESAGGLRDLHTALWAAQARYGPQTLDGLRARGVVSESEHKGAVRAYDFLWRVRHAAHFLAGRKADRLALDLQPRLAEEFGYKPSRGQMASERFMRDYYRHARSLNLFAQSLFARAAERTPARPRWFARPQRARQAEAFEIVDGRLRACGDARAFEREPSLLFDAFAVAQAACVPFEDSLRDAVRNSLGVVGRDFRASSEHAAAFLRILRRRGRVGFALRQMHEAGFLARYLPEFGRISLLIQHDLYHHYTVDEHTLKAVEALDAVEERRVSPVADLRAAFGEVRDPALVYLSVLMHDIGKGGGRGHIARGMKIAERVCRRLRLDEDETALVVLMVEQHVAMARLALRRDLNEPRVAEDFAARVRTLDGLNTLLLLTYADLSGVGPGVWSEWKGALLWELYRKTRVLLTGVEAAADGGRDGRVRFSERVAEALAGEVPPSEVERHLALLPERYARVNGPEEAARHLRLVGSLEGNVSAFHWRASGADSTELTVCARDRHRLFADIAGTLASRGVEILGAEINTREDGVAIDVLLLRDAATRHAVEEHKRAGVEKALMSALAGAVEVAATVERWRRESAPRRRRARGGGAARLRELPGVVCDNEASPAATVVEIHAADEPGLAYKIASALAALRLDIVCAKIATEKSDALDVFYVTDEGGSKLSDAAAREVEKGVKAALAGVGETVGRGA